MLNLACEFASLMLAAFVVGVMFAVCLLFNPSGLDAPTYVTHQQWGIRTLHPKMPLLGSITAIAIFFAAVLSRDERAQLTLLLSSSALFISAGIITRLLNMPINAVVMSWSPQQPPPTWGQLRDAWWRWHLLRFSLGVAGMCLLILAVIRHRSMP